MRPKTQVLIMQNYESIKQRMLSSENGVIGDYFESLRKRPLNSIQDTKITGYGFLAGVAA